MQIIISALSLVMLVSLLLTLVKHFMFTELFHLPCQY